MKLLAHIKKTILGVREFIAPSYRPERHYMRGPGPACARAKRLEPSASFR